VTTCPTAVAGVLQREGSRTISALVDRCGGYSARITPVRPTRRVERVCEARSPVQPSASRDRRQWAPRRLLDPWDHRSRD
jgi:hypothetical protein